MSNNSTSAQPPSQRWRNAAALHHVRAPAATPPAEAPAKRKSEAAPVVIAPPVAVQSSRCVLIPLAAAMTGMTVKAIERKIQAKKWAEGRHYHMRDGRTYIDMKA